MTAVAVDSQSVLFIYFVKKTFCPEKKKKKKIPRSNMDVSDNPDNGRGSSQWSNFSDEKTKYSFYTTFFKCISMQKKKKILLLKHIQI